MGIPSMPAQPNAVPTPEIGEEKIPEGHVEVVTEERVDDQGRKVIVTRKILKKLVVHKVPKEVAARRHWTKFGDAKGHPPGPNTKTTLVGEQVFLRLAQNRNWETEEKTDSIMKADKVKSITCRHCQGAHWTSKCPIKDMLPVLDSADRDSASPFAPQSSTKSSGRYVPPSQRRGTDQASTESLSSRDDSLPTIRVTNLSENAMESDLRELFGDFGTITRTFVAKDHHTGRCKGFAFVTYNTREAAAEAIKHVDRHPYDNLILKVEWANPSNK